jgi:hypothetical protein
MRAIDQRKETAMAISFPASEAAAKGLELEGAERAQGPSLLASAAHLLRRGYERVCSTIFDAEGDCMRF